MKRFSVDALDFEVAELFGERVLFHELRIQRESVPKGLRLYELRHEDEDDAFPCQIADGILVNFYGSVLTNRPVQLFADGRLDLLHDDFGYADDEMTVKEYLAQYPPENTERKGEINETGLPYHSGCAGFPVGGVRSSGGVRSDY